MKKPKHLGCKSDTKKKKLNGCKNEGNNEDWVFRCACDLKKKRGSPSAYDGATFSRSGGKQPCENISRPRCIQITLCRLLYKSFDIHVVQPHRPVREHLVVLRNICSDANTPVPIRALALQTIANTTWIAHAIVQRDIYLLSTASTTLSLQCVSLYLRLKPPFMKIPKAPSTDGQLPCIRREPPKHRAPEPAF